MIRGEAVGVLGFSHHSAPVRFTPAQVDFAENLAASLSLGLENARLYEAQKHIADTLQASLLRPPATLPDVEVDFHYRSATEEAMVGGDFFDAFSIHRYLVGLVVGDYCGHGVEAASIASVVRDTFRAYAFQGLPLGEVLALTNDAILRQTVMGPYTTVFAAFLNTRTGGLDFCSAGHPPALLRRTDGEVQPLEVFGPPLGAFAGTRYHPGRVLLNHGETLLLYTDGLIEARLAGSYFGEERLVELLRAHQGGVVGLPRALLEAATRFTKGCLHDDVAILAVARSAGGEEAG
jgi:serine phosphatase RsbU (regulator of sigma subunit)